MKHLKNGRCRDTAGLTAELLKAGGETIVQHLLKLFNDILTPDQTPPEQWRRTTISVIFKSGDPRLPGNYRPIAIVPLLYKLMSRLLCNRLAALFDSQQSPDQAGFRKGFCTEDHLFTATMLHEHSYEWQLHLWAAAIDFKKAFDCVDHDCLWEALRGQSVPAPYITLLQKFYSGQVATVKTDVSSRSFNIERGVKQGDPLSSYLFNALLEHVFRQCKPAWERKGFGIQLGHTKLTRLTNLRFADDVLLIAPNLRQLKCILRDLKRTAAKCGLELHPDKTKIFTNMSRKDGQTTSQADIDGDVVAILKAEETTKYLGRKLALHDYHRAELSNRIAMGWGTFNKLRDELTSNRYPLHSRLRLFNGTVTPTVMYGCTSWTLTKDMLLALRRTQRRMLRLIVNTRRRRVNNQTAPADDTTSSDPEQSDDGPQSSSDNIRRHLNFDDADEDSDLEPWDEFIRRATYAATERATRSQVEDWTTLYHKRKWRWAGRIATQSRQRWTRLAAAWDPDAHDLRQARRRHGGQRKRWSDDITQFLQSITDGDNNTNWVELATNTVFWHSLENDFIAYSNI